MSWIYRFVLRSPGRVSGWFLRIGGRELDLHPGTGGLQPKPTTDSHFLSSKDQQQSWQPSKTNKTEVSDLIPLDQKERQKNSRPRAWVSHFIVIIIKQEVLRFIPKVK